MSGFFRMDIRGSTMARNANRRRAEAQRILVVEDNAIVALDLQRALERLGYSVAGVVDRGEDAVAAANDDPPDLVLMDIVLAGEMDGVEAARRIRDRRELPIVFVTAHADGATFGRARSSVPDGYVLKPFEDFDLRAAIEIALERRRAASRARGPASEPAAPGERLPREFGARVRALRRVRDLTQAELATRSALSVDGVRRLERGAYSPSLATLMRLAKGLGVSLEQLIAPHTEFDSVEDVVAFLRTRSEEEVLWAGGVLRAMFHR